MEVNLCGSGHCPKVITKEDGAEIGEDGNKVKLKPAEWNALIDKIQHGELDKIQDV